MAKRSKKLAKGIESLKEQIKSHFSKIEKDIQENKIERGEYHTKEIDKSLIDALEHKLNLLGEIDGDALKLIEGYRTLLEKYKKKLGVM